MPGVTRIANHKSSVLNGERGAIPCSAFLGMTAAFLGLRRAKGYPNDVLATAGDKINGTPNNSISEQQKKSTKFIRNIQRLLNLLLNIKKIQIFNNLNIIFHFSKLSTP